MEELKPSLSGRLVVGSHSRGDGPRVIVLIDMESLRAESLDAISDESIKLN